MFPVSDSVRGNLQNVFKESYAPTDKNDRNEGYVLTPLHVFEAQVPIPGKGHESVGKDKKQN